MDFSGIVLIVFVLVVGLLLLLVFIAVLRRPSIRRRGPSGYLDSSPGLWMWPWSSSSSHSSAGGFHGSTGDLGSGPPAGVSSDLFSSGGSSGDYSGDSGGHFGTSDGGGAGHF